MAVNYANQFNTRKERERTPQQKPIPGSNQVKNSAGGFSWQITPWQKLERFLILGAEGGSYYVGERDMIKQSHDATLACIKEDGVKTVQVIRDISLGGRAYKNDPAIFALALVTAHGGAEAKAAAYQAVPAVCRIGTHLFHFAEYVNAMRGWGRGLRNAVAAWYGKTPEKLALQAVKYQQRDGWSHADLLRLAHPKATSKEQEAVFRWMLKGVAGFESAERMVKRKVKGKLVERSYTGPVLADLPQLIDAFERAKKADEKELVALITEHGLPREAVPTEKLNSKKVWEALLASMPPIAMIRNLGKMTNIGLIGTFSDAEKHIVKVLSDQEKLQKARVHPMQVLLALKTYGAGKGFKGSLTWSPSQRVLTALDSAFYMTFKNVKPVGKPMLFAMDISSSMMGSMIAGTHLSAAEASAALVLVHVSTEPENCEVRGFAHDLRDLRIRKGMRLEDAMHEAWSHGFGSTDCSIPFEWLINNRIKVGGVIVTTDSETGSAAYNPFSGRGMQRHPAQALKAYRSQFVEDCRSVVMGMTANDFSIADPNDPGMLDVVGFDANVPGVLADFIRGEAEAPAEEEPAQAEE